MMTTAQITDALKTLIEQKNIAVESLTRDQLAEAFRQALACGDFVRTVRMDDDAQQVVYIPFREVELWKRRFEELRAAVEAYHQHNSPENYGEIIRVARGYDADPRRPVIHLLRGGRTLCNKPGLPRDWEINHLWESDWPLVNCQQCLLSKPA